MGNETGNEAVYRQDVQLADSGSLLVDEFVHFDIGFNYWMEYEAVSQECEESLLKTMIDHY